MLGCLRTSVAPTERAEPVQPTAGTQGAAERRVCVLQQVLRAARRRG